MPKLSRTTKPAAADLRIEPHGDGHEMANRFAKALKLAAVVDAVTIAEGVDPHADAASVRLALEKQPLGQWAMIAVSVGERPPSAETRAHFAIMKRPRGKVTRLACCDRTGYCSACDSESLAWCPAPYAARVAHDRLEGRARMLRRGFRVAAGRP